MASSMITDLPLELHISISEYLLPFEIRFLSQSCVSLRNIYHPLLYSKCHLVENNTNTYYVFIHHSPIPDLVLYHPTRYSWFPYKNVKAIYFSDSSNTYEIIDMLPVDKYSSLQTVSGSSFLFNGLSLSCYDKILLGEHTTCMQTKHVLSIIRRQKTRFKISRNQVNPRSVVGENGIEVFNCSKLAERKCITSLKLKTDYFQNPPDIYSFYTWLLKINCFPNLKEFHWVLNDRLSKTMVKKVVSSLPRCSTLEKLRITYQCIRNRSLYLLDNLRGSWKCFFFYIETSERDMCRLRLPSVTHLKLDGSELERPNIEYGIRITTLVASISYHINPFASEKVQDMLYNIRTLSVKIYQVNLTKGNLIFRSLLPNLKALHLDFTCEYYESTAPYYGRDDFQFMLEVAPFGDFDMLNVDHMEKLVNRLQERCKRMKFSDTRATVQKLNKLKKSILTAVQNSDFLETSQLFHTLQFISFFGFRNDRAKREYVNDKSYISFTLHSVKQYLPNIEFLRIDNPMFLELYPMLFHVLKCQKSLKQFYSLHGLINPVDSDDKLYKRFCNCMYLDPVASAFLHGDMKAFHSSDVDLEDKFVPLTEKLHIEHNDYSIRFQSNSIHLANSLDYEYFHF